MFLYSLEGSVFHQLQVSAKHDKTCRRELVLKEIFIFCCDTSKRCLLDINTYYPRPKDNPYTSVQRKITALPCLQTMISHCTSRYKLQVAENYEFSIVPRSAKLKDARDIHRNTNVLVCCGLVRTVNVQG